MCSGVRVWCPLTKQCEVDCGATFGSVLARDLSDLDCGANGEFCSNQESCSQDLACPASYEGD